MANRTGQSRAVTELKPMALSARTRLLEPAVRAAAVALATCLGALGAGQAAAGWRDDMKSFRIGLVAADGEQTIAGLSVIKRAFAEVLGVPVDILAARDYAALIEAEASG